MALWSADCFYQSASPIGKQVASDLLKLTTFAKLGLESGNRYKKTNSEKSININYAYILWPYGQAVKTSPFHGGIPGSNPGRVTNLFNKTIYYYGRLAQLGEHLPYKQGVIGSSPIPPTNKI